MRPSVSTSLLVLAGVGAAHLVVKVKQGRDAVDLGAMRMHQALLAAELDNPELRELWFGFAKEVGTESVYYNQWVCLWSFKHRHGLLPAAALRDVVRGFMTNPRSRAFWQLTRLQREIQAKDGTDRSFNRIMNDEYDVAVKATTTSAADRGAAAS